jgi:hypothetical protein
MKALAQSHGNRILQLGPSHLDHIIEFCGLVHESIFQTDQFVFQRSQKIQNRKLSGCRDDIIGGLGHVHVVIGMNHGIVPLFRSQEFTGPVCDDLIHVHIGTGSGAALDRIHKEVLPELALHDFVTGCYYGIRLHSIQFPGSLIGHRSSFLDHGQIL